MPRKWMKHGSAGRLRSQMRFALALLLLIALMPLCLAQDRGAQQTVQAKRAKRVLVISLDGLDARYLSRLEEYKLRIPTLRHLIDNGVWAREGVISVYPSVTYAAHTTIVTGALPARHGIYGNEIFEPPDGPQTGAWQWFARDIRAETLWDAAAKRGLKTAMISWPVSTGAGDYNFPEIWKPGGTRADSFEVIRTNARPAGLVEELRQRDPQLESNYNADEGDDMRTRFAEYIIKEKRPSVVLVHLFDLDHFQHVYGPFTPQAFAILEKVDGYVARILEAARRAGTLDETAVFIVSDHGFMPIEREINPGVLLARSGLLTVREEKDAAGKTRAVVTDWRAAPYRTAAACAIILKDPNDKAALRKVRDIFRPLAGRAGSGIFRVLEKKEIAARGANPRAALMLDAADGYTFGSQVCGDVINASSSKGQHGYLPTRPRFRASFIVSGAGVRRRGNLGEIRMTAIGPTIAGAIGLILSNAEGRAIKLR